MQDNKFIFQEILLEDTREIIGGKELPELSKRIIPPPRPASLMRRIDDFVPINNIGVKILNEKMKKTSINFK
ncbi:hypothetical protein [Cellulosilyticum ruminicola]|uniref:hypothetical protein n=1 Tax=Cellulosilyticum ruminicola TaxID=425254 RepID=UPI0006D24D6B|nr:hypothetical protein [Cellulosilyticum ruminicola]